MVQSTRWIEGLVQEQLLTAVAQKTLRQRLKTVWDYAPLAAKKQSKDIEYVHQLRVATRRAGAALQIFADLLPEHQARWMKKTLRGLRHAASDARDLDVLAERLADISKKEKKNRLQVVIKEVSKLRRKAQKPIVAVYEKAKNKRFKKRSRLLCKNIAWRTKSTEPTFAEAARTTLDSLFDAFFQAGQEDLSDVEMLHQLRISGKRVRYAVEIFSGAFDEQFRKHLYPTFEVVQKKLGVINDHATAIAFFNPWRKRADTSSDEALLKELVSDEETQLGELCQTFCEWWTPHRRSELAKQFKIVLKTPL